MNLVTPCPTRLTRRRSRMENTAACSSKPGRTPAAGEAGPDRAGKKWGLLHPLYRFREAKIVTVEPVMFLVMFSRFLYAMLYEQYYYLRFGEDELLGTSYAIPNSSFCLNSSELDIIVGNGTYKVVEKYSNHLVIFGAIARRLPSIFATLVAGPLSDRFGRRPVMMVSVTGFLLQGVVAIIIARFKLNIYLFIAASAVCGIGGEMGTLLSTCFAYVADIGSKKWRSFRIGIVEGCLFLGGALGQGILGFWLSRTNCDFMPPLYCYTACNALAIAYIVFILPESLTKKERQNLSDKSSKGFGVVLQGVKIFFCGVKQYSVWRLWAALLSVGIVLLNVVGYEYIMVYFLKAPPFDWDTVKVGLAMALHVLSRGLSLLLVLPVLVVLKFPDALIALIALIANCLFNALTGFSKKTYQIFTISSCQGLEAMMLTTARAMMSKMVAPEHQGALFSFVVSTEVFTAMVGQTVFPYIYPLTLQYNLSAGTTFLIMAALCLPVIPLLILLLVFRQRGSSDAAGRAGSEGKGEGLESSSERERLLPHDDHLSSSSRNRSYGIN